MTKVADVSISVMTHPLRRHLAREVVRALRPLEARVVVDPDPWGPPRTLRTSIEAWRDADTDRSYHLVVQDDVQVGPGFDGHLADLVGLSPQAPVALGALWNSRNGSAVRWGAARGARFVAAVPEYVPCFALLMPSDLAGRYVRFAAGWESPDTPDDVVMGEFLAAEGVRPLLTVPSLVEHRTVPSLVGNDYGVQRMACFGSPPAGWFTTPNATITGHRTLPVLRQGRMWLCSGTSGYGAPWEKTPLEPAAHRLGWRISQLTAHFDAFLQTSADPVVQRWSELVSPRVLWTAWLAAHALRVFPVPVGTPALPEPDGSLIETSLRTILAGGFLQVPNPSPVQRTIMAHLDTLMPVVRAGWEQGPEPEAAVPSS